MTKLKFRVKLYLILIFVGLMGGFFYLRRQSGNTQNPLLQKPEAFKLDVNLDKQQKHKSTGKFDWLHNDKRCVIGISHDGLYLMLSYFDKLPIDLHPQDAKKFKKVIEEHDGKTFVVYTLSYGNIPPRIRFSAPGQIVSDSGKFQRIFEIPQHPSVISPQECARLLKNHKVIFLTGAGISRSAGILTMQELHDKLGISAKDSIDKFTQTMLHNPQTLFDISEQFWNSTLIKPIPTKAHYALSELAIHLEANIMTGNFDRLHEASGIRPYHVDYEDLSYDWNEQAAKNFEYIICIGSSYDFHEILGIYKHHNPSGRIIAINKEQPNYVGDEDLFLPGDIQEMIPLIANLVTKDSLEIDLPKPSGSHAVGIMPYHLIDQSRQDIHVNTKTPRELMVQIWYPALGKHAKTLNLEWDLELKARNRPCKIYSWATVHAPAKHATTPYPVIIFSPGHSEKTHHYTSILEELVSHGYIVIGIMRPYATTSILFPNGRIVKRNDALYDDYNFWLTTDLYCWRDDIKFVLDSLTTMNEVKDGLLYGMFDLDKIASLGHSYGAAASIQFCKHDERCIAAVSLDGFIGGNNPEKPFGKPCMFLTASEEQWKQLLSGPDEVQRLEQIVNEIGTIIPTIGRTHASDMYKLTIDGATHMSFSDYTLLKKNTSLFPEIDSINGDRMNSIVCTYLLAFFNQYLKGVPSSLLNACTPPYPEVAVECWLKVI